MSQTTPRNDQGASDVSNIVKDMLDEMESEFTETGNNILERLNEINKRMDDLDSSISDLMNDAGLEREQESSPTSASASHASGGTTPNGANKDTATNL